MNDISVLQLEIFVSHSKLILKQTPEKHTESNGKFRFRGNNVWFSGFLFRAFAVSDKMETVSSPAGSYLNPSFSDNIPARAVLGALFTFEHTSSTRVVTTLTIDKHNKHTVH